MPISAAGLRQSSSTHSNALTCCHICRQGARKLDLTPIKPVNGSSDRIPRQVVYVPSCVTRMMGPALPDPDKSSVADRLVSLFKKADYEVLYPQVRSSCEALTAQPCHWC